MAQRSSGKSQGADIFERLKRDHEEIKGLFARLEKADGGGQKVFAQLKQELQSHTKAEERVFYQPLKSPEATHEMILEGVEEHHVGDLLIKELSANRSDTDQWHAKAMVLKEIVEHHVEEEEKEIFKQAKKLLKGDQPKQMVQQFETEKKRLMH